MGKEEELKPVILPGLPGLPIPGYEVELLVNVDDGSRLTPPCNPPPEIAQYNGKFLKLSLPDIVHWGTVHFQRVKIKLGANETRCEGRMREVWHAFLNYDPRPVTVAGYSRLIVSRFENSDVQSDFTEIFADAVGVAVAAKILKANFGGITKRNFNQAVRHDYDIALRGRVVKLETRGRFNAGNRTGAIREVDVKFSRAHTSTKRGKRRKFAVVGTGDYSQSIGALVYPSSEKHRTYPDVELLDPTQELHPPSPVRLARILHRHYQEFFLKQNVKVAERISELLEMPDKELDSLLRVGDVTFKDPKSFPPLRIAFFGRTRLWLSDEEFIGTYFDEAAVPPWVSPSPQSVAGVFFFGVWRKVIERLGSYRILEMLEVPTVASPSYTEDGNTFVLHSDGLLTAWLQSSASLKRRF